MATSPGHGEGDGRAPVLPTRQPAPEPHDPIAIVGIGCRFPGGAGDPEAFWGLLEAGADAIREVPADRWAVRAFHDPDPSRPGKTYSRWGGFVDGIDRFDPEFFGISPREAARMDPQQRLLMEVAWEGLEDAGLRLDSISGSRTAVFVGISSFDYSLLQTSFRDRGEIDVYSNTGGSLSIAANRISYSLDLHGPSAAVDTACSSALVAVHLACRSIWLDGCPLALAGGVNALLLPDWYVGFCRMGMLSPHGRCRAFDAAAAGFVRSEGAGMVVLKPLSRAVADGDRVYAVIRGTAMNQDGRTHGMTVPSQEAQEALLREACRDAGVAPAEIRYVEAHGTGTLIGDPIEARALGRVLSDGRPADRPCLIGSVKTNIGHLEAGAGIAGLIKTALALHHRQIPGNLHFDRPNPDIDLDGLRLRVPTKCEPWPAGDGPALAGVNAFGFGGTNAHVVLQEAPSPLGGRSAASRGGNGRLAASPAARAWLVPLSARSPEALRAMAGSWDDFLAGCPDDVTLEEIAVNAALRRTHHDHRLAIVVHSKKELGERLRAFAEGRAAAGPVEGRASADRRPRLAFVCSGQGPQWWAMGRRLLREEPVFRDVIERCDAIVRRLGEWSLLDELTAGESRSRMDNTAISQPCIFALQVGLAELWAAWGVRPEALVGHSVGEVAAAYLAGVFSLEDAVRIIYQRGRCMERAPGRGGMLAAGLSADEAAAHVAGYGDAVALAAVNGPNLVTLSGERGPLEEIAGRLESRGVFNRFLRVHYAFHSAHMDPIREELIASLQGTRPGRARLPLISTVTGRRVEGPELGPEYWWQNVRRTVRFADGVGCVIDLGCDAAVELSPHPVLAAAVTECYQHRGKAVSVAPSLRRQEEERATLLQALGVLHGLGYPVDWHGLMPGPHRFVRMPLYPWRRERFWHESQESRVSRLTPPVHPLLGVPQDGPRPSWESRLDLRLTPYLADHRVQQAALLPAAGYLELAFAAACASFEAVGCELREVKLANPCFLATDRPLRLQTAFDPDSGIIHVHTHPVHGDKEWTLHLTASLHPRSAGAEGVAIDMEGIRGRCPREFSGDRCYAYLREIGLDYGPMFRGIERVWQGERESLGSVRLPDALERDGEESLLHTALLDACLQAVIPADGDFDRRDGGLYLPHEIDSVRLLRRPGPRVWVHARLLEKTDRRSVSDVDIYTDEGRLAARVRGLRSLRVAGGRDAALDDLFYAYQWRPQPPSGVEGSTGPTCWLIFADAGGLGARLADRLRARGDECTLVDAGEPEDLDRLIGDFVGSDPSAGLGIVHLWNLDAPRPDDLDATGLRDAQEAGLLSVVRLVQAWDRVAGDRSAPFYVATRGAQSVRDRPEPAAIAQAPVVGLGRVIAGEYPRLKCRLVDLDPEDRDGAINALLEELRSAGEEDEVAWRGPARFVHRYLPAPGLPPEGERGPTRADGPYRLASRRPGTLEGLVLQTLQRRAPAPGEVEIDVVAAGLNFSDVMKALGMYPGLPDGPISLGAECSGRIAAVGEGVDGFRVGDEVLAVAGFAVGSHAIARAELVAHKPDRLSFEQAATIPIAFLTAAYALDDLGRLRAGDSVLIHSASGGVGLAAIQLARRIGAEVLATAGTPEKREYLRGLGIEAVMDSRTLDFADEVIRRTGGRGVDAVLNSLPGEAIARGIACLADHGRFLEIGKRDIYQNARLGLLPFHRNLSFFAIDLDRVIRERPALLGSMLREIVRRVDSGELDPLPSREWPIREAVDALRFMQSGKHIGKVVLTFRERPDAILPAEDEPLRFRSDASYLITGGLGGFGLAVARWLAERGAGTIVLMGRRGADAPEASRAVAELEALGARVVVHAADVTKESDVAAVLAAIDRDGPPLRGVFHAAMVLEDALLTNLDRERMDRVLAPKLAGTWNLHMQTAGRSLDWFVMFSSLSSVFGHAGQGNYASANAFLDAMAWYRRALGSPALTVNWGYLGEVGYLARRAELGERLERQGVLSFSVRQALALLEKAMQRQHVQISVMRVEWSRWRGLGVTGRVSPRFAHLCCQAGGADGRAADGEVPRRETILAAGPEQRSGMVEALLHDKVARVLGTSPDRLDGDRPLLQLGIDSLMAVELRNWLEGELRVDLPIVELMRSPSLTGLAAILVERLGEGAESPEHQAGRNGCAHAPADGRNGKATHVIDIVPAELLERIDDLSGDQIDALLAALLDENGVNLGR
jgi:acyl transferase domain-containing protein/NADPH:quinone reductase-like Zn-dependent oxidoreductase/aryl carrier-like protein